ncbi:MAG: Rieske (2Fe-2S) protein [Planctomycetes bacterium]|nr:Rieske (2Fe-2S) protein [Planctomycetota bacterium]
MTPTAPEPALPRRDFLDRLFAGSVAATLAGGLAPVAAYLWGPEEGDLGPTRLELCPAHQLPRGKARMAVYRGRPILVLHGPDGLVAVSAICTHLGCLVRWSDKDGEIRCPCHGGRFDAAGKVLGGPVAGPLAPVPVREEGGLIVIGG